MNQHQYLSRSIKRRRFLEEVEVIDLFNKNPSLVSSEPQPTSQQVNILENDQNTSNLIIQHSISNFSNFQVNNLDEIEVLDSKSDSYNSSDEETIVNR